MRLFSAGKLVKEVFVFADGEWGYGRRTRGESDELPEVLKEILSGAEDKGGGPEGPRFVDAEFFINNHR